MYNYKGTISVAMAVYNGQKYLDAQVQSILKQLREDDQLVISYNESADRTWELIQSYAQKDSRVQIVRCAEPGVNQNFEHALKHCRGDYIFLSDQDDVWLDCKVEKVMQYAQENRCQLVLHDTYITDEELKRRPATMFAERDSRPGLIRNLVHNAYHGSCMAFSQSILKQALPIPQGIGFHDRWIGELAEFYGKTGFLKEPLMEYRRHETNASTFQKRPLHVIIKERARFIRLFLQRILTRKKSTMGADHD